MPKTKRQPQRKKKSDRDYLKSLTPYMTKIAKGSLRRHKMFSLCVKASVCKCFEFNQSVADFAKSKSAFFAMASLRGICEDLIVLRYMSRIPQKDREILVKALAGQELSTRVKLQAEFFSSIRPQQSVLQLKDVDSLVISSEAAARAIWQKYGWPNLSRGAMPQIRQIAEKQGLHQLTVLYDYLYRLTSAGVHFNVQSLLRSGWGSQKEFVFSTRNFHAYYENYCTLYGQFLFCLYFEFFSTILRPSAAERAIVNNLRESILFTPRWPEMVTYEEMNLNPPEGGQTLRMLVSGLQAVMRKRLISKGVNYTKKTSSERRQISQLLRKLFPDASRPSRDT